MTHAALASLACVALAACDNGWDSEELLKDNGTVDLSALSLTADGQRLESLDGYTVTFTNVLTREVAGSWAVNELPSSLTLPAGTYAMDIASPSFSGTAWEAPYFHSSTRLTVQGGETTVVGDVDCALANVALSVDVTAGLAAMLPDGLVTGVTVAGDIAMNFTSGETRRGYFEMPDGGSTIEAVVAGDGVAVRKVFTGIEAGKYYRLTLSRDPLTDVGTAVTMSLTEVSAASRPGQTVADGPQLTLSGAQADAWNDITDGFSPVLRVDATNGISKIEVTLVSDALTAQTLSDLGLFDHFELASPGEKADMLTELGMPVLSQVSGQSSVDVSFAGWAELLAAFPGSHRFIVDVTDAACNRVSAEIKLRSAE